MLIQHAAQLAIFANLLHALPASNLQVPPAARDWLAEGMMTPVKDQ